MSPLTRTFGGLPVYAEVEFAEEELAQIKQALIDVLRIDDLVD